MTKGRAPSPAVTVVIATYNRAEVLRLTLESVRRQDFTDFEVRVVGDACTDETEAIVASFGDDRFTFTNLSLNSGSQAAPNNHGLRQARGAFVAYLGHDDLWMPHHLSSLVDHLRSSGADFAHSLCALIGPGRMEAAGPPKATSSYSLHWSPPSSWMHRREVFDLCGPWADPGSVAVPVDGEYMRRACRKGVRFTFLPVLTVLKFPSHWWGTYALAGDPPQRLWLDNLIRSPVEVERKVLTELAVENARDRRGGDDPLPVVLSNVLRVVARSAVEGWGRDRWPLEPWLRRRARRQRRAARRLRGLPPL